MSLVLDSLDDIHFLQEAPHKEPNFLNSILDDRQLHALLEVSFGCRRTTIDPIFVCLFVCIFRIFFFFFVVFSKSIIIYSCMTEFQVK